MNVPLEYVYKIIKSIFLQNIGEFFHLCLQIAVENLFTMNVEPLKLHIVDTTNMFSKTVMEILEYNSFLKVYTQDALASLIF